MASVRIVIVAYNSADIISDCLESVLASISRHSVKVVVVDNASSDGTCELICRDFPVVEVVSSGGNPGFGTGNNIGAKYSREEYLFFMNPDVRLQQETISALADFLETQPEVGIVSPLVLDETGQATLSTHRFLTPFYSIWIALGLDRLLPLNRTDGRTEIRRDPPGKLARVDRVLGAAFLMRRSLFEAIGGFDERFFLYSEEEDLCLRVNLSGYQVVFNPDAAVIHLGGRSAHPSSTLSIASAAWSRQYFLRKHYSAPGVFFSAVVWTVALSARLVAAAVTFRGAKRIRGYYRAIRSLLSSEYYQNRVRPN